MDPVLLFIGAVVVVGGVVWFFNKDKGFDVNNDGKVDVADVKAAVDNAKAGVKKEVAEAKAEVKAAVAKLPTPAKLKALTKAGLEDLGREFGVELDKRKNKDAMIADLKSGVKANQKK